jgi:hypothetical protein
MYFAECQRKAPGKEVFAECHLADTRQRLTAVIFRRPLTALCRGFGTQ